MLFVSHQYNDFGFPPWGLTTWVNFSSRAHNMVCCPRNQYHAAKLHDDTLLIMKLTKNACPPTFLISPCTICSQNGWNSFLQYMQKRCVRHRKIVYYGTAMFTVPPWATNLTNPWATRLYYGKDFICFRAVKKLTIYWQWKSMQCHIQGATTLNSLTYYRGNSKATLCYQASITLCAL